MSPTNKRQKKQKQNSREWAHLLLAITSWSTYWRCCLRQNGRAQLSTNIRDIDRLVLVNVIFTNIGLWLKLHALVPQEALFRLTAASTLER